MPEGNGVIDTATDGEQVVSLYGAAQLGIATFKTLQKWERAGLLGQEYISDGWTGKRYQLRKMREVAAWRLPEEQAS